MERLDHNQDLSEFKVALLKPNYLKSTTFEYAIATGINRSMCGKDTCDPAVAHRCDSGEWCDNAIPAGASSPELLEGKAIGLETDIYAFGIVAWEAFTLRQASVALVSRPTTAS